MGVRALLTYFLKGHDNEKTYVVDYCMCRSDGRRL